jgi:hypothetical protein
VQVSRRHPEAPRFHQRGEGSRVLLTSFRFGSREILRSA